jgi:CrcB protein
MSALAWIAVALIGGCAAVARVSVDSLSGHQVARWLHGAGARLAVGTFVVNLSGVFLLGLVDGLAVSGTASVLIATAGLGAYTTFSTWMLETQVLQSGRERRAAAINVIAGVLIGFGAVALGHLIGTVL